MTRSRVALAALALAATALLALVALSLALPRLIGGPEMRRLAEESAARALGRQIGYERPRVGILPPALVLERPWIAGAREGDERLLEAESLALELALWPLLERRLVVRSLDLEAPTLRLERSAAGLEVPLPPPPPEPSSGGPLVVERVKLRHATLVLRDTVVSPNVTTELEDLALDLERKSPGAPLALEGSFELRKGRVRASGSVDADGAVDLELAFDDLPLEAHAAYLGLAPDALAARVDGEARLRRPAGGAFGIEGRVVLGEGRLRLGDLEIGRGARARVALEGISEALHGRVDIDARAAKVAWPGIFSKAAGRPGELSGELRTAPSGALGIEGATLRIGELRARGRATVGATGTRVELRSDALSAEAAAALFPVMGSVPDLTGSLRIDDFRLETGQRFALTANPSLRDGVVRIGALEARGTLSLLLSLESTDPVAGSISIGAGDAAVALADILAKPAGVAARFASRIEIPADRSVAYRDARLEIGALAAEGAGTLDAGRLRLDLHTGQMDAVALAAVFPHVGRIPGIGGALALRRLHVETDPLVVDADAVLAGLSLTPGTPEPIRVDGPIAVRRETVRAAGLRVEVGGQPMTVDARVRLGAEPVYEMSGRMRGADAQAFLRGLVARRPALEGRLDLDAQFAGPLASRSLVETGAGTLRVHVAPGRIPGVSVLESSLAALSAVKRLSGLGAVLAEEEQEGSPGSGDRFRTLDATVRHARGISRTEDLRIVYPTYDLALAGEIDLVHGSLKMRGDLLLGQTLVSPFGRALGLFGLGCAMPNRIPIPEISGPVSDPSVRTDASYVVGFLTRCSPLERLGKLGKGVLGAPGALKKALGGGKTEPGEPEITPSPGADAGSAP